MIFSLWKLTKDLFCLTFDRDSENLLPFPMKITVFFVFYWHLFKILRKNGKVAESGPRTGRIRAIPAVSVRRYTGSDNRRDRGAEERDLGLVWCLCIPAALVAPWWTPGDVPSRPGTGKRTVQSQRKRDAGIQFL